MKAWEQLAGRVRVALRVVRAAWPGPPAAHRPVRVVLRWPAAGWALADLRRLLVEARLWLGPARLQVRPGPEASPGDLLGVVRFGSRLDLPVHLLALERHIAGEEALALDLLDAGLAAATVRRPDDAAAFESARRRRPWPFVLVGAVPPRPEEAGPLGSALRRSGVDALALTATPGDVPVPVDVLEEALGDALRVPRPLRSALAGGPRRWPLPARLELRSDGRLQASAWGPVLPEQASRDPRAGWAAAREAVGAALRQPLPFDPVEMVPRVLYAPHAGLRPGPV